MEEHNHLQSAQDALETASEAVQTTTDDAAQQVKKVEKAAEVHLEADTEAPEGAQQAPRKKAAGTAPKKRPSAAKKGDAATQKRTQKRPTASTTSTTKGPAASSVHQPVKMSDFGTSKSLFGTGSGSNNNLMRITLIAGIAALLVAAIAWWVTGGFGMNERAAAPASETSSSLAATSSEQTTAPAGSIDAQVDAALAKLSLEQKVAQMFILTPEGLTGAEAVMSAGDVTRLAIMDRPVGGICYFDANLSDPQQTREMLATVQQYSKDACGLPVFLCVDEEGGEVSHIANNEAFGVENVGSAASIGATGQVSKATSAAKAIATSLTDLGFNVDFAPVADIAVDSDSVMADRSFGSTAEAVSPMVEAQVKAFTESGIVCAAKHFPGIGGAYTDPHYAAIATERTLGEMQNEEFKPFQAAISAGVPMIMMGHISATEATGSSEPASLSKEMITDVLRNQLGYEGIVITDSMMMGAITDSYDNAEIGVKAIQAGADIILMPSNFEATYRGVLDAINAGQITEERIDESVRRIIKAKLAMKDTIAMAAEAAKKDKKTDSANTSNETVSLEANVDGTTTDQAAATDTDTDTAVDTDYSDEGLTDETYTEEDTYYDDTNDYEEDYYYEEDYSGDEYYEEEE